MFFNKKLPKKQWCTSYYNKEFMNIKTCSGFRMDAYDPAGYQFFLVPSVDDITIGEAVLKSLSKSRIIKEKDIGAFFDFRRIMKDYQDWVTYCQKTYGYKTKKVMFKHMDHCSITCENNLITIMP